MKCKLCIKTVESRAINLDLVNIPSDLNEEEKQIFNHVTDLSLCKINTFAWMTLK